MKNLGCQLRYLCSDISLCLIIRELWQATTSTATRPSPKKRFNEQNNGSARAFWTFVHFFAVLSKTTTWTVKCQSCTYFGECVPQWLIFRVFPIWNWTLSLHIQLEQVFRPLDALNRSTQLRHSRVNYNLFFHKAPSSALSSSLLKVPVTTWCRQSRNGPGRYSQI